MGNLLGLPGLTIYPALAGIFFWLFVLGHIRLLSMILNRNWPTHVLRRPTSIQKVELPRT